MFHVRCFCIVRTIAQFGSALDWGSRGRGFKSRWSDQKNPIHAISGFLFRMSVLRMQVRGDCLEVDGRPATV